jgi:hypothetical protein
MHLTVNPDGAYSYSLPRFADACYNIQYVFEEGEECDIFLQGQNITNMFTKNHPLYLIPLEFSGACIESKNKPKHIYVNWIYVANSERSKLYDGDFTTVNAFFTALYSRGFLTLYSNDYFKELHFVAKRIQRWYKKWYKNQKTKRYQMACRHAIQRELIYLPPWSTFPGGIVYQDAKMSFEDLRGDLKKNEN